MRAALYARFSTDMQNPASIADQLVACRALAGRLGATVVGEHHDAAISGWAAETRPGLQELLASARAGGVDLVIAEAIDRLARSGSNTWAIYEDLTALGVRIHTIAEGEVEELAMGFRSTMNALFMRDLARKTRRGVAGVVRDGRHAGGRVYGYRRVRRLDDAGQLVAGVLEVDEAEAAIVRRIFREYAAGASPRAIVGRLNAEAVPGPRGGPWNASTVNGNAARGNGVLHNELYRGVMVWGRQTFSKDRRTGRRRSRAGDPADQVRTEVPHLRILDESLWAAAQAAFAAASTPQGPRAAVRPKHLLSGLMRCGACGGPMTLTGPDGRFLCVTKRERGRAACAMERSAKGADVEARVLACLRENLLHPAVIEEAVREFHAAANARQAADRQRRTGLERELDEVKRRAGRLVDQVADGHLSGASVRDRLAELEARRAALEADLQAAGDGDQVVTLHPKAGALYRAKVERLQADLNGPVGERRDEARQIFRDLVPAIHVIPEEGRGRYGLEVEGDIAKLLRPEPKEGALLGRSWVRGQDLNL